MQSAPGPPSPSLSFMLSVDSHQTGFDTGINHQQLPHPRPIYTTPHSPPQFFFGAVGKVKVYTWNPILQQHSLEFLIFGPKLLYDMLVIGPKDTTIALKKKTNTWDHCCVRADTGEESTHGFLYTEWLRHACLSPCMIVKFWTVHFFKLKCFRVWIGSETLVHIKKRMVKSFYYHNSTPPQWKPPGLSGLW